MEDKASSVTTSSSSNLAVPSSDKGERSPRREKKDKDKERRASSGNVVTDIMQLMTRQTGIVHEKDITECPVEFVTVYSDRAEVTRKVTAKIEKEGVQKITIQGFPTTAVDQSFRMSGGAGHATIFEVGLETKTITTQPEPVPVDWTNRLEEIPVEIEVLNTNLQCLEEEKRWLNDVSQNKKHIHENNVMGLEEIANYFKFFAESMARLNGEMHQIRQKITTLRKEEQQIREDIAKRGVTHSYTRRDFSITFYSPGDTKLVLQVTYLVNNVNFSTMYDIRVGMNPPEPLSCQLMYFAEVRNNSSEDWTNVKMAISTARPAVGSKPPKLAARRLRIHVPAVPRQQHRYKRSARDAVATASIARFDDDVYNEAEPVDTSDNEIDILPEVAIVTSTVEQSALGSVTFHVPQPCNVPADGKGHKVSNDLEAPPICIAMVSLDMKIIHEAVPSLSSSVFMRASGKNTSPYLLLPGNINVFLNGSFLTTSSLALTNKDEDLQFYLGIDDSVKLVIKPEEVVTGKTGIIKKSKTENTKRSITIKNTKPIPIDIQITEQCPTSQDDSIKIKLHEPEIKEIDKSIIRDEQNNLRWTLNIGAGKEKAIGYHYSIEYPAEKIIEYF